MPVLVTSMERPFVGINLDAARTRTGAISPFLSDRDFQMATRKKHIWDESKEPAPYCAINWSITHLSRYSTVRANVWNN